MASTWIVTVTVASGGAIPTRGTFEVDLPDPAGFALTNVLGAPVSSNHTVDTFSVGTSFTTPLPNCAATVSSGGSAPIVISSDHASAAGPIGGTTVIECAGGVPARVTMPISGDFFARTLDIISLPSAMIEAASGVADAIIFRRRIPATPGLAVPPGSLVRTGAGGSLALRFADGSLLTLDPGSTAAFIKPTATRTVVFHLKGRLHHSVTPSGSGGPPSYRVVTSVATIEVRGTEFVTEHSETAQLGSTAITVQTGTVDVTNRRQQLTALTAGLQTSIGDTVPRVTPVLPVDGGSILQGQTATFTWTAFAGASGYLIEYTFAGSGFASANPPAPQTPAVIPLPAGSFTEADGLVSADVLVPDEIVTAGVAARWRIFPVDASGRVLAGSTGSDASVIVIQ
jgi:hypothetical protein